MRRAASWLLSKQTTAAATGGAQSGAAGRMVLRIPQRLLSRRRRHRMALMALRHARADVGARAQQACHATAAWPGCWACRTATAAGPASIARTTSDWLTQVPFADHNAMIDPSTRRHHRPRARVPEPLRRLRRAPSDRAARDRVHARADSVTDGSWFGRWGVNYIYGTWQVLRGLRCIGEDMNRAYVRARGALAREHQNADGGWGESIESYDDPRQKGVGPSTPSQTAWALMGLIAAGQADEPARCRRGVRHLLDSQTPKGRGRRTSGPARASRRLLSQLPLLSALLPADGAGAVSACGRAASRGGARWRPVISRAPCFEMT